MAREQTVVALGKEAKALIASRMRERGETASTYFSNPAGGRTASTASFDMPPDARTVTAGNSVGFMKTKPGISAVAPDKVTQYRSALVRVGLSQGMQDADLTMNLYTTPEERRAARKADADRLADAQWAAEKRGVIGRLDAKVSSAMDSAGHIAGRPLADTAKWGRTIQKANADARVDHRVYDDDTAGLPSVASPAIELMPKARSEHRVYDDDDTAGLPAVTGAKRPYIASGYDMGLTVVPSKPGAKVPARRTVDNPIRQRVLTDRAINLWSDLVIAKDETTASIARDYDKWLGKAMESTAVNPPSPLWQFDSERRFNEAAATAASHKRLRRK